jgi:hypothetical protein
MTTEKSDAKKLAITEARLQEIIQEEIEYEADCKYLDSVVLSEAGFLSGLKGLAKGAGRGIAKGAKAIGKGAASATKAVGSAIGGAAEKASQATRRAWMQGIIDDSAQKIKKQLADLTKNVLADEKVKKAGMTKEEVTGLVRDALKQALGGVTGDKVASRVGAGDAPAVDTRETTGKERKSIQQAARPKKAKKPADEPEISSAEVIGSEKEKIEKAAQKKRSRSKAAA